MTFRSYSDMQCLENASPACIKPQIGPFRQHGRCEIRAWAFPSAAWSTDHDHGAVSMSSDMLTHRT